MEIRGETVFDLRLRRLQWEDGRREWLAFLTLGEGMEARRYAALAGGPLRALVKVVWFASRRRCNV